MSTFFFSFSSSTLRLTNTVIGRVTYNNTFISCSSKKKKKLEKSFWKTDNAQFIIQESFKVFYFLLLLVSIEFFFCQNNDICYGRCDFKCHTFSRIRFSNLHSFRTAACDKFSICFWWKESRFSVIVDGFLHRKNFFLVSSSSLCRDSITTKVLETIHCLKCWYLNVNKGNENEWRNKNKRTIFFITSDWIDVELCSCSE